ncbi:LacI family DNA-binding transcriptional regulator [Alkalihalobacillus deserti]|uniref:LacI family DNA-binding transcriptional regulator n=1 Tax=Alkalihalobacillus deserti TaxID=2879466 RepID=UPI001D132EC2|nr:LacI family DNA-binding transcriptional regulator [Alkalihalobacillus deserti]
MYTIQDIAKLSGVSKSTVSRVLNNHPYVSEEKRKKVQKAIQELNYFPNGIAKQFRAKKTNSIGIITPQIDHPYYSFLIKHLSTKCYQKGYKPVILQTFTDKELEIAAFLQLKHKELDGIILTSSLHSQEELSYYAESGSIAVCNESFDHSHFDVFCINEEEVTFQSTTYLLEKGLSRLGFCSDNISTPSQQARLSGFKKAHIAKKIDYKNEYFFNNVATINDGINLGNFLYKEKLRLDGVFAGSDFVAAGIIKSAIINGVSIPKDFSVIGFDNHPISTITTPSLTTISNCIDEMTTDLVNCLIRRIEGNTLNFKKTIYKGSFIVREST